MDSGAESALGSSQLHLPQTSFCSQKPQFFVSKMLMMQMALPPPSLVEHDPYLQHLESAMCPRADLWGRASSGFLSPPCHSMWLPPAIFLADCLGPVWE